MSNNKRPFPNKDIFEVIDTEEKAYWLGFLYADGSVGSIEHKIELGLKMEDIGHVQKFKDFVGLSNKISNQKNEFIKFLDLLYQDATIYLDRKYEKYLSYKKIDLPYY